MNYCKNFQIDGKIFIALSALTFLVAHHFSYLPTFWLNFLLAYLSILTLILYAQELLKQVKGSEKEKLGFLKKLRASQFDQVKLLCGLFLVFGALSVLYLLNFKHVIFACIFIYFSTLHAFKNISLSAEAVHKGYLDIANRDAYP